MRIGFIGAGGKIAGAIINGILSSGIANAADLYLYAPRYEAVKKYVDSGAVLCSSNIELCQKSDYIFLCVKPQIVLSVLSEVAGNIASEKCIISNVAGTTISTIKNAVKSDCGIVRVMPNTPLMLSCGASGIACDDSVSDEQFEFVYNIYSSLGVAVRCREDEINAVTAVSGSGPAYVFRFAREIINEAVDLGLNYDSACKLMYQTLIGSAVMLRDSGKSADELIDMVTSPNGTTYAALQSMNANRFDDAVRAAIKACKDRADELGK